MGRERVHQFRERGGTLGREGITPRAKYCQGVYDPETQIVYEMYPDSTDGIRTSIQRAKELGLRSRGLGFGEVILIQPKEGRVIRRVHGINDGTEETAHPNGKLGIYDRPDILDTTGNKLD